MFKFVKISSHRGIVGSVLAYKAIRPEFKLQIGHFQQKEIKGKKLCCSKPGLKMYPEHWKCTETWP